MSRRRAIVRLAVGLAAAFAFLGIGQEPILTFSVPNRPVPICAGGSAEVVVSVENDSVREADDIDVDWAAPEAFAPADPPEEIALLPPFERAEVRVRIEAPESAVEGEVEGRLAVSYTYCILEGAEERCYRFDEELPVALFVESAAVPVDGATGSTEAAVVARPVPWAWIGFGVAMLSIAALLTATRLVGVKRIAAFGLACVVAGALAYGVARNQHEQAQGIGAVLCTSCVGIEEAGPRSVELSDAAIAALGSLEEDVELIVFYARWCHSCPAAEAMVERMADATARIAYRFVDVEVDPELAEAYGIVRSGRTVVPAIVRNDGDEVLFGAEDLEARLLEFLGVAP